MGGAQPLAITLNGGVAICIEADADRIQRRLDHRYLDALASDVEDALRLAHDAKTAKRALSIGLHGNAAEVLPALASRRFDVDVVTDQTSAHDPMSYIPAGLSVEDAQELRLDDPTEYVRRARESMARHVDAMIDFLDHGAEVFDYGNSLRAEAKLGGSTRAFEFPGFVPAYIRPLFCEGKGPFRWVALSGDAEDIAVTDRAMIEEFSDDAALVRWIKAAGEKVRFQGLPARICWLGYGERARAGPYRETEAMRDGSDAIADWPILNALLNTSSGASWVSVHHGGGVGIGRSIHAGMVVVADGTVDAARKLERVLTNDPGTGVMRHADAGYVRAIEVANERGVRIPMQ